MLANCGSSDEEQGRAVASPTCYLIIHALPLMTTAAKHAWWVAAAIRCSNLGRSGIDLVIIVPGVIATPPMNGMDDSDVKPMTCELDPCGVWRNVEIASPVGFVRGRNKRTTGQS